jgi:hypothetical protein
VPLAEDFLTKFLCNGIKNKNIQGAQKLTSQRINTILKKWANKMNIQFSKVLISNKYMRKYSPSLAIKEMQIKITLRFHLTPVRVAIINNTDNNKCWQGCRKKPPLFTIGWNVN